MRGWCGSTRRGSEMTQDEVIAMAREAGFPVLGPLRTEAAARFAALVSAKEREACAQVCDGFDTGRRLTTDYKAAEMAAAIRAKGNA